MPNPRPVTASSLPEMGHPSCPPGDVQFTSILADFECERPADRPLADADADRSRDTRSTEGDVDGLARDTPSPTSTDDLSAECDQRLSQSITSPDPAYNQTYNNIDLLGNPFPMTRHLPITSSSFLRPGSKFVGTQRSEKQEYEVQVEVQFVNMEESTMCGYLRIQGLTDDHPTLTTYFDGEMIGSKYGFITKHPDWGASEKVDMHHWARFPQWRPLQNQAKKQNFSFKNFANRENIFMRWKESFLVPDHRVRNITGASFEGFYYICFNQVTGSITGIYFHAKTEKGQRLDLKHVDDRGCSYGIEFR